ncbi:glycosyltransferase family 2 protein [Formosa haliotis]|uniref:glycosyltransferase family 2 protein n=1 Tax=Formosa haliotis TaxID=1555194 RepID=UPI000826C672|nr:glycosyltransferase family 2 protein [Formosa haliotis]
MLSVLIPIYNYNVVPLVKELHKQLMDSKISFEIICVDDCSAPEYIALNRAIDTLSCTSYLKSPANYGRTKTRQLLSDASQYDWLLFLDADVLPTTNSFIKNYIALFNTEIKAFFGGISYKDPQPKPEFLLHWKYGIKHEATSVNTRKIYPYKNIVSANMCMKKDVFNLINSSITYNAYGLDNYFGSKLKALQTPISHIDNPVFHLGLETNLTFITKKEEAADTLLKLIDSGMPINKNNKILVLFLFLKKTHVNQLISTLYKQTAKQIKKQLTSKNPSIKLLQAYRIMYMCYSDLNRTKN